MKFETSEPQLKIPIKELVADNQYFYPLFLLFIMFILLLGFYDSSYNKKIKFRALTTKFTLDRLRLN